MRPTCFICFQNLVCFWEDFSTKLSAHPLQTSFSDYILEELRLDGQVNWEDSDVDPEADI